MVSTSGSVAVKTDKDAEAILWKFCLDGLAKHAPHAVARGVITDYRQSLIESGRVILYAGERYRDGFDWQRSW